MNANRAIQLAVQRTQGLCGPIPVCWEKYDCQRTPVIRIAVTLAIDSAIGKLQTWEIAQKEKISKRGQGRVQKVILTLWRTGSKGLPRVFCTTQTFFAPAQPHFAPVQEASCSLSPEDLLHHPLTTFWTFSLFGQFPSNSPITIARFRPSKLQKRFHPEACRSTVFVSLR